MTTIEVDKIQEFLQGVRIPARPEALQKVMHEAEKDCPDLDYIASTIAADMGLAAAVLKIINSPLYGLRSEVVSIKQAVSLLGLANIVALVNGYGLRMAMGQVGNSRILGYFWDASGDTATAMAMLGPRLAGISKDVAYTFGLFSRCGIPLLMQKAPDYVRHILGAQTGTTLAAQETNLLGANHAQIGALLARKWSLPLTVVDAIALQDDLEHILSQHRNDPLSTMVVINTLAEHVSYTFHGLEWLHDGATFLNSILAYLGLSEPDFEDIREDIFEKLSCR